MNAPLVSWAYLWSILLLHPPKSDDDRYAQLTRGAFITNDFLRNPHFSKALHYEFGTYPNYGQKVTTWEAEVFDLNLVT
jgi:hypothetical protein